MSFILNIVIIETAEDLNHFRYPYHDVHAQERPLYIYQCAPYTTAHSNMARHLYCARVVVSIYTEAALLALATWLVLW